MEEETEKDFERQHIRKSAVKQSVLKKWLNEQDWNDHGINKHIDMEGGEFQMVPSLDKEL